MDALSPNGQDQLRPTLTLGRTASKVRVCLRGTGPQIALTAQVRSFKRCSLPHVDQPTAIHNKRASRKHPISPPMPSKILRNAAPELGHVIRGRPIGLSVIIIKLNGNIPSVGGRHFRACLQGLHRVGLQAV